MFETAPFTAFCALPGLVYYNYRHYNPLAGRWTSREPIGEFELKNLFGFCANSPVCDIDSLGLSVWIESTGAANGAHERICVDLWKESSREDYDDCFEDKFYKKKGKYCIAFGKRGWSLFSSSSSTSSTTKNARCVGSRVL